MGAERLAVYTTMYPGCERFVASWCRSWREQTDRDCDLWVGLDALTPSQVMALTDAPLDAVWVGGQAGDTPASIRQRAFSALVVRYDKIVLVDVDDLLDTSRVAAARAALDNVDVAGCALAVGDAEGNRLGFSFGPCPNADLRAMLARYNVFGLSNSAYRASVLEGCLPVPGECVLIDWLLATRASVGGARLFFDPVPRMTYRQYDGNAATIVPPFSGDAVLKAAALVVQHYRTLLETDWPWPEDSREPFEVAGTRARRFLGAVRSSPALLRRYVEDLNRLPPQRVWWWAVAHPELENLWIH
jgi:hypothetical protein